MSSKFTRKRKPSLSIDNNSLSLYENPLQSSFSPKHTFPQIEFIPQIDSDVERNIGDDIDGLGMSRNEVKRLTQSIENRGINPTFIAQQLLKKRLKNEKLRNARNIRTQNMTDEEKRAHKEKRRLDRIRYRANKTKEELEREAELAKNRKQKFMNKRKKSGGKQTRKQTNKYKKNSNMRKSKKVYK